MFSIEYLHELRRVEIDDLSRHLAPSARILEIGAGTGFQARLLAARGFDVTAIEVPDSNYATSRVFPITDFDGRHIPFESQSFDIVFSSNVMEHVLDLPQLNREIRRVLRPDGYCIHALPTHGWRLWTTLSAFPTALQYVVDLSSKTPRAWLQMARRLAAPFVQRRHGERGNAVSELWLFRPHTWRRAFRADGFEIVWDQPLGLFYTGNMTLGRHLPFAARRTMAKVLGSACHVFKLKKRNDAHVVEGQIASDR